MKKTLILLLPALCLAALISIQVWAESDKPCPWRISGIEVGKWGNGRLKASIWAHGSFPIPPGVSERPTWFVNGINAGHSQIHFNMRRIPNAVQFLRDKEQNTVTVRFLKPPYNGASHTYTFHFDPDKIGPGQYKKF